MTVEVNPDDVAEIVNAAQEMCGALDERTRRRLENIVHKSLSKRAEKGEILYQVTECYQYGNNPIRLLMWRLDKKYGDSRAARGSKLPKV